MEGLSEVEVRGLAEVFFEPMAAGQLLESVGLNRGDHPAWVTARLFWGEVSRLLRSGVLPDGRRLLLAEAAASFPANEVFAGAEVVGDPARRPRGREGPGWPIREIVDPFALEVHPAIDAGAAVAGLPLLPDYVVRDHDLRLREVVSRAAAGDSSIVMLVGGSSTGKTRACWEAVQALPEEWRLWHPIDPSHAQAALNDLSRVGPRTVVWLNEAQHYLLTSPADLGAQVAAALRELLRDPARRPVLVLGTLWPDYWADLTQSPAGRSNPNARALLVNADLALPDAFVGQDLERLRTVAGRDPRLAEARARAVDGQVTQYLAGAPELLGRFRNAPPGARAVIEAAMDARRLGHGPALPRGLLEDAASGYLSDQQWDLLPDDWFDLALDYAAVPCRGVRGALTRIRPRPGQPIPSEPRYQLADYLEQHARASRRLRVVPTALWDCLVSHATPRDAALLAARASSRLLHRHAIPLFGRALSTGDPWPARGLAALLAERGEYQEAERVLLSLLEMGDKDSARDLVDLLAVRGDADGLQRRADLGDLHAAHELVELLARNGEPEKADQLLRTLADSGDRYAAGELAEQLAVRGDVDGLRARARARAGDQFAAGELADLFAKRGDVDGLRDLVDTGHQFIAERLARLLLKRDEYQEAEQVLRVAADAGDTGGARELVNLLARRGDLDGLRDQANNGHQYAACELARLLAENGEYHEAEQLLQTVADAGDENAARQLASLLTSRGDVARLRDRAEAGDGYATHHLAALLAGRGEQEEAEQILRTYADYDGQNAAERMADLLAAHGKIDALQARADAGDKYAARRLASLVAKRGREYEAEQILRTLVATATAGPAGRELAKLLVKRGEHQEAEQLLQAIADAGDENAARQLAWLLATWGNADRLRARANVGDEYAAGQLALLLAKRGQDDEAELLLRTLIVAAGSGSAARRMAEFLVARGRKEEAERLRRFGVNPDGSTAFSADV
ncbi:effector-associated domain EAD1-containing protein [Frankia sp. AgW1.1]|uniref:effector-associated domain EAD1-containing protein n=1 Tax=Frankia sp. AgW1.1 TaxID=1836971 RepID=UPI00193294A9|nr:effector-associated domain EAD1-containing protein [Frankia sp. AgW1.1]